MEIFGLNIGKSKPATGMDIDSTDQTGITVTTGGYGDRALYNVFKAYPMVQKCVKDPAQQATREGWQYKVKTFDDEGKNKAIADAIAERDYKLKIKRKYMELIKYSRIYEKGGMIYIGVNGDIVNNPKKFKESKDMTKPIPDKIKKIEFMNVITNSEQFQLLIDNLSNPTIDSYNQPKIHISGLEVNADRVLYLVNDFDPETQRGISVVQNLLEINDALTGSVKGTKNILERLGAIILKSKQIQLSENTLTTIRKILKTVKNNLSNTSVLGLDPSSEVDFMNFSFSGLNTAYEFIFDIISMYTEIPKSILIGSSKANMITGEGERGATENYYDRIRSYQENTLDPIIRKVVDLYTRETDGAVYKLLQGKPLIYDVEFEPLTRISRREEAEVSKLESERDKMDIESGKISPIEAVELDPRYKHIDTSMHGDNTENTEDNI